jgi:hypothetical protein
MIDKAAAIIGLSMLACIATAAGAKATVLKCKPIHSEVYDNKNERFTDLTHEMAIAVDFEAQYAWFGGDGRWMRMSGVDGTSDEIVAFVRTGSGAGYFALHFNRNSKMLIKTTNTVYEAGGIIGVGYEVFHCS